MCKVKFADRSEAARAATELLTVKLQGRPLDAYPPMVTPALDLAESVTGSLNQLSVTPDAVTTSARAEISSPAASVHDAVAPSARADSSSAAPDLAVSELRNTLNYSEEPDEYVWGRPNLDKPTVTQRDVQVAVRVALTELRDEMRESDTHLNSFIAYERNGEPCVRSQMAREPTSEAILKSTWIWVTTTEDDKPEEWHPYTETRDEGLDRDSRKLPKVEEVFCARNPFEDTIRIFPDAIGVSRIQDELAYEEGQVLGADQAARAVSNTITAFSLPGLPDQSFLSAMSRGFLAKYPRPPGVGASWGDWDTFREWQLHGRHLEKAWVQPGDWKRDEYGSLVDGDTKTVGQKPVFDDRFEKEEDMKGAETLYEHLHKPPTWSQRGGARGGARGGRRGGHRGGQRGGRPAARNW
ncbi:hypothetical protein FALBO_16410 [Fusarium albosuccineum]|uniref:Uncharacterized protein n=1 Tax=Fusarium albosuccineum TaxID=1237068 RepID=A0A8H4NZ41_9HYPO|nr:hypothetical protein FALBO_16410 [Fusarium albosuccineum]